MMKKAMAALMVLGLGATVYAAEHPAGGKKEHPAGGAKEHPTAAAKETAAPAAGQTTLKDEVVDMSCYIAHGSKGKEHKTCAVKCLKGGSPVGILSEDGSVYLVVNHTDEKAYKELKKKVAETVTVTGRVVQQKGVQGIEVSKVE